MHDNYCVILPRVLPYILHIISYPKLNWLLVIIVHLFFEYHISSLVNNFYEFRFSKMETCKRLPGLSLHPTHSNKIKLGRKKESVGVLSFVNGI